MFNKVSLGYTCGDGRSLRISLSQCVSLNTLNIHNIYLPQEAAARVEDIDFITDWVTNRPHQLHIMGGDFNKTTSSFGQEDAQGSLWNNTDLLEIFQQLPTHFDKKTNSFSILDRFYASSSPLLERDTYLVHVLPVPQRYLEGKAVPI